ncbi:putative (S)-N-methylcoclaurine 3'-hydroxylase isozyme 2 [Sesamum angolense]|uniref:(S)-N-methylcoclaurine 3'-hydroxylase isozyme 2 n=1 Tax=Sesamum angolense TaxID=2727404 RepID=A0AAE1VSL7_9LAMI|nr:putative (S)-N-methylcoclaurine 3'-hydroxylase isozyme 2 [Sesamum angolense]
MFEASAKLPPGPNAWQLLWSISQLKNKPHVAFHNLAKIYGPLFSMRLGGRLLVVASSPATAKAILKTHDRVFSGRFLPSICYAIPSTLQSYKMRSTSKECNGIFEYVNCIVADLFSTLREVESKGEARKEKVLMEMVDYVVEKEGEVVDLDDVFKTTLCNIFANVVASRNLLRYGSCGNGDMAKDLVTEIGKMMATPGLVDLFPVLRRVDFWRKREGRFCNGRDLPSHQVLNIHDNRPWHGLLIAGDSGLVTTRWLMAELMRNQDTLSRGHSWCHLALENCVLNDYIIPKDTIVVVNAWAIQLDPENWKDATSFKPDRFLGSNIDFRGNHFEFIPFSSGRRMCSGYQIGFRNVQLVVACLIHYFDWSLPDGENPENLDMAEVLHVGGLTREKPLFMIPKLREKYVL